MRRQPSRPPGFTTASRRGPDARRGTSSKSGLRARGAERRAPARRRAPRATSRCSRCFTSLRVSERGGHRDVSEEPPIGPHRRADHDARGATSRETMRRGDRRLLPVGAVHHHVVALASQRPDSRARAGPVQQPSAIEGHDSPRGRVSVEHASDPRDARARRPRARGSAPKRLEQRGGQQRLADPCVDAHQEHPADRGRTGSARLRRERKIATTRTRRSLATRSSVFTQDTAAV